MTSNPTRRQFMQGLVALVVGSALPNLTIAEERRKYATTNFVNDSETVLLARMIFGEARSCVDLEKIAVAYTTINRATDGKKWNGETVKDAILKPNQYSCFNRGDANRRKIMDPEKYDAMAFERCLEIAEKVLSGKYDDPTNGATHYFNPKSARPKWAGRMQKIGKIQVGKNDKSKHEFYKE